MDKQKIANAHHKKHNCLNCHQPVNSNFCPNCGQNAATHRFSLKHFFLHDFVHGVFHLDKGFIYTIKELFTRPGHSIRGYVEGKRAKHFNYFTFTILIITIGHVIGNISEIKLIDTTYYFTGEEHIVTKFEQMTKAYPKLFTMVKIPLMALLTFLFFKKSKQNFTEHLVLNIYKACGELLIAIVLTIFAILFQSVLPLDFFINLVTVLTLFYSVWFYYQYFSVFGYSKLGLFIRSLFTSIILFLVIVSVNEAIIGIKDGFDGVR